jgi:CPA2 family monovalent cation:H+ antiporter-2
MICVIGSDEQVKEFADFLTKHEIEIPKKVNNEVILKQIELQNENFIGQSIGQSKNLNLQNGLVAGIERNGKRLRTPNRILF